MQWNFKRCVSWIRIGNCRMIFVWCVHLVNQEKFVLLLTEVYLVLIYVFNIYIIIPPSWIWTSNLSLSIWNALDKCNRVMNIHIYVCMAKDALTNMQNSRFKNTNTDVRHTSRNWHWELVKNETLWQKIRRKIFHLVNFPLK